MALATAGSHILARVVSPFCTQSSANDVHLVGDAGPTCGKVTTIMNNITIPTIDISPETGCQVVIAQGTQTQWHGHSSTLLLPDGKTMFCAWAARFDGLGKHGAPGGMLKRSDDGGLTWSDQLDVPGNWREIGRGAPTLHRLVDANGQARIFIISRDERRTTFLVAMSEDEGKTWTPTRPIRGVKGETIFGWTSPMTIMPVEVNGVKKHLMWYERNREGQPKEGVIWQSASSDGGLTWGESRPVVDKAKACEPAVVRSPDGSQLLILIRENSRQFNSLFAVSNDEGQTWSDPQELPAALTGDRHQACYASDGRLVVMFRDTFDSDRGGQFQSVGVIPKEGHDPTDKSHCIAWVGRYEDIIAGGEGGYRIKLLHSYEGLNHTYSALETLPDGTFVATTYIKYRPGSEKHSVVSTRFHLSDMDVMLSRRSG